MKIVKRKVEVNIDEFRTELKALSMRLQKHFPERYGVFNHNLKSEMEVKLTELEFYELSETLGLTPRVSVKNRRFIYWRYEEIQAI